MTRTLLAENKEYYMIVDKDTTDIVLDNNTEMNGDTIWDLLQWFNDGILRKKNMNKVITCEFDFSDKEAVIDLCNEFEDDSIEVISTSEFNRRTKIDKLDPAKEVYRFLKGETEYLYDGYNAISPKNVVKFRTIKLKEDKVYNGGIYKYNDELYLISVVTRNNEIVDYVYEIFDENKNIDISFGKGFSFSFNLSTFIDFLGLTKSC